MMQKITTIIGVVLVSLLLTACSNQNNGNPDATGFLGGTQGVQLSFGDNAPPSMIADGGDQPFPVIVKAENLGEEAIPRENATITLEGFSFSAFNISQDNLTSRPAERIQANRQTPDGEQIDADLYLADESTPCEVSSNRDSSSSGAPVQITDVEQDVESSDTTGLTFTVKNQGSGDVYQSGTTCTPSQGQRVEGDVIVRFSGLDGVTEVNCRSADRIGDQAFELRKSQNDLRQGDTFRCAMTIPQENRNNREEPFTAELSYLYETSTSKTLTVRNTVQ